MEIKDILVSVFPNVRAKDCPKNVPLTEILDDIKTGKGYVKNRVGAIRKETDHSKRNELKLKLLPAFCPSGIFERMEDAKLVAMSGIVCIDLDNVPNLNTEISRLKGYAFVLSIFKSPSGEGIKILVAHDLREPSRHKDLYWYVGTQLELTGRTDLKFDTSCSNISHPCFWSYDKDLYINKDAEPLHINLSELPAYTPSKGKAVSSEKAMETKETTDTGITLLTDTKKIKDKIVESHTLFEEYYNMYPNVRNTNLFILASFFHDDGIPENYATDYLVAYYSDADNGFPASEIRNVVRSAYNERVWCSLT